MSSDESWENLVVQPSLRDIVHAKHSNEPGPPEDLFMLAINWRKDDCWAGQGNNYRA